MPYPIRKYEYFDSVTMQVNYAIIIWFRTHWMVLLDWITPTKETRDRMFDEIRLPQHVDSYIPVTNEPAPNFSDKVLEWEGDMSGILFSPY